MLHAAIPLDEEGERTIIDETKADGILRKPFNLAQVKETLERHGLIF